MNNMLVKITIEEARRICDNNSNVLVAIKNIEEDNQDISFEQKRRKEYDELFKDVETVISSFDDFVMRLDCYTNQQDGLHKIILIKNWE